MSFALPLLYSLVLTLLAEISFGLVLQLNKRQLSVVILMNIMTNPAANILYRFLLETTELHKYLLVLLLEAAVIAAEYFCCRGMMKGPLLFVLGCNFCSYMFGMIVQMII